MRCYNCNHEWKPDNKYVYTSCDTINGQYTEFDAACCPKCGAENSIGLTTQPEE
jgi:hypothetical protein